MITAAKDFLKIYWPLVLVAIGGLVLTLMLMDPAPPKTIRFAAGAPGGAYYAYAERYQRLLAEEDVTVELIQTAGSVENLRLLDEGQADVALVQGGLATRGDAEKLRSLGGLFHEPFWVFVRDETGATQYGQLRNKRLAIGPVGSGTRLLAIELQEEFDGVWPDAARNTLSGTAAAEALIAGQLDAAAFSASPDAPYVQTLLRAPGISLMPFERAEALSRRQPALAAVTLLRGVVDIGADLPAHDIPLVAPVAQLVVDKSMHPAIEALLVDAAAAVHQDGSLLARAGTFPDPDATDLPVSRQAERYYENGPSFLRRYFSFDVANFLDRAWILAIPLLTLLFPLVRAAPPIYRWRVRRKIYIWYKDLRDLEARGRSMPTKEERVAITDELEDLQAEIGELDVPLSYTDDLYRLRNHVEFVKHLVMNTRPTPGLGI
ncbi:MAG: TRAP ABC transporter substrate-binding protein [Hyphomonas sp. BRH_c22]|uniref:TAXI family TRAP transporter solute-binding subunit n=1 Tax=Hyphomonas sp. BRH_c22 TaxID=1629710 RepID=UPI0005F1F2B9|nr:TAXI family TRAP transporter solute-binding subunit [Hyphomonas sp. BRH_c22]KJS38694.1 MAG: TRAP ABC transporter substrate-binding protein [Hyphomonas sp. BRH_c22]